MHISHRIRVCVKHDGEEEPILKTARARIRSRLLDRLCGAPYSVLVLTPSGVRVDAVEIREEREKP